MPPRLRWLRGRGQPPPRAAQHAAAPPSCRRIPPVSSTALQITVIGLGGAANNSDEWQLPRNNMMMR